MSDTRLQKTTKNIVSSLLLKVITMLMTFTSRVIFVKVLSVEYLGINGLFSNILNILSLADLGMSTVLMYSLYKPLANDDKDMINNLIYFFRKVYLYVAAAVTIIGIVLIPFLKYIVNFEKDIPNITIYYLLFLANNVMTYLFVYRSILISADQKQYILSKWSIIFQFITFISQTIFLLIAKNYLVYLIIGIVCSFLCNLVQNKVAMKMYPYLKEKSNSQLTKNDKKDIFDNVKSLFLYKIGTVVQSNTDNILISIYAGTVIVGFYSNYTMVINNLVIIVTIIFTSVKASIGSIMVSDNDNEHKYFIFNVLELIAFWLVGFSSVAFIILIPDFISILFGSEFLIGFGAALLATMGFYTSQIRQAIWTYRETTGLFVKTRHITLVTSALNLILSIILGKKFGLFGILAGTIIARMLYAWWREPIILYKTVFNKSPMEYYVRYFYRLCICVITFVITNFLCNFCSFSNCYVNFVLKMFICAIIPNTIFYFLFFRKQEFKYIYSKLMQKRFIKE